MDTNTEDKRTFLETADSRETSRELMEAILYVAGGNEMRAKRIWGDPTREELLAIWERVTQNGLHLATDYCWGESGSNWVKMGPQD